MKYPDTKDLEIPKEIQIKWQNVVDTIAELLEIPAALIMKVNPPYIEVFKASETKDNPYEIGDKENLSGLYCETVILTDDKLMIPNALKDENWNDNPDIELGMISYLGFPIKWPDGDTFGTLCVLDKKEKHYGKKAEDLLKGFKELLESHLELIYKNIQLAKNEKRLNTTLDSIGDGVITTDLEGKITRMNPTAEKLTGWGFKEASGKRLNEVFKIENTRSGEKVTNPVDKVLKKGEVVGLANDTTLIAKDGKKRQIADSAAPIRDDNEQIIGIILVFSDVTDKYEAKQRLRKSEQRYHNLFDTMLEGARIISYDWEYLYVNQSMLEQFGIEKEEIIGKKVEEYFPQIKDTKLQLLLKDSMENRITNEIDFQIEFPENEVKWFHYKIQPVSEGIFVLSNDITTRKKTKLKLKEENKWLSALYENTKDPIVMLDKNHCVVDVNQAFEDTFGYKQKEIENRNLDEVLNMGKKGSADKDLTHKLLKGKKVETEGTRYDRNEKPIECIIKGIPVKSEDEFIGAYAIYYDITDRKKREEKVRYISYHDNLTDLYNRSFLETEIKRLDVERQLPLSMIMIDLNGLKLINDTYGHKTGDKFLIKTAEILKNIFRQEDLIARWGGDEFVILLNQTNSEETKMLSDRIKNIEETIEVENNNQIPISLAVGHATKNEKNTNIYELFKEAEDMMYRDKLLEKKSIKSNIIDTLLVTLRQKSSETEKHAERMKRLAIKIGNEINLPKSDLDRLSLLAVLHDIGKTIIPEKILNKPEKLTKEEWKEIKKHPGTGYRICSEVDEFSHVAHEILAHHEYWNGKGYPKGTKGENIPLLARIISIVDAYDVMTHDRPYCKAISKKEALKEIENNKGKQFDPNLTEKFVDLIKKEG